MKVKIELDGELEETEVLIRCRQLDDSVITLQNLIAERREGIRCISLRMGETSYYVPVEDILFFETEAGVIHAHTADRLFEAAYKLYELEDMLPSGFMRISKSTIVNLDHIYSLTRNLTASSVVEFAGSGKKALVSRGYYKALVERLGNRKLGKHYRKTEQKQTGAGARE